MSRRPTIARPAGKPIVTDAQVQKFKDDCKRMIDDMMTMFINPLTDMVENTQSYMEETPYTMWDQNAGDWVEKMGTFEDQIYTYARDHQEDDPEGSYLNIPARLDQLISQFKVVKSKLAESSPGVEYRYVRTVKDLRPSSPRPSSPGRSSSPTRMSGGSRSSSPTRMSGGSRPSSPTRMSASRMSGGSRPSSPARMSAPRSPVPTAGKRLSSPPRSPRSSGSARVPFGAEEIEIPEDYDLEITKVE